MADVVLSVLLLAATAAAVLLAHRALRHWWSERAGRPYELPADRLGTALRAGAAGVAALTALALAVPLLSDSRDTGRADLAPAGESSAEAAATVPPAPSRTPAPAPPAPEMRTVGHPAGGTLMELRDGIRVWLPPRYASAGAASLVYPVVLAHLPASGAPDLFEGFAVQAKRGLANPFLLVMPRDCGQDPVAVLAEAARHFRALPASGAHAVIGLGAQAPCAVHEALAHPGRYRAAAGISGTYPPPAPAAGPHPALLLAATTAELAPRASALRLRAALRPRGDQVRIIDGVRVRREMYALVAGYLTEKLEGPSRKAAPSAVSKARGTSAVSKAHGTSAGSESPASPGSKAATGAAPAPTSLKHS
ncbi:hypothetical protein [Streptomyces sp. CBMA29]|uniref:hypothetical protein n=1 Tax=Streptomyces sp. CBMA29 TaxID=1896314 RepID=UPI001661A96C|nr:hypothetical protein [Streptomyces sp. CBMA29]MBD0740305.1 hypothetical protein [Streptomyces sp. CBMA29]